MRLKPGVDIRGIQPEIVLGICIADSVYLRVVNHEVTITSVRDGEHMIGSLHNTGYAADLRTNDVLEKQLEKLFIELKEALGAISSQFDLIFESNHLHLEFDPDK